MAFLYLNTENQESIIKSYGRKMDTKLLLDPRL